MGNSSVKSQQQVHDFSYSKDKRFCDVVEALILPTNKDSVPLQLALDNFKQTLVTGGEEAIVQKSRRKMMNKNQHARNQLEKEINKIGIRQQVQLRIKEGDSSDMNMIQLICNGLYLSSQQAASSKKLIETEQITHIVCCYETETPPFPDRCKYLICDLEDDASEDISAWFYETYVFISNARKENGKVLVHCVMGVSRSATIVIAYMMKEFHLNFRQAFKIVRDCRPMIQPNYGFIKQLLEYEKEVKNS